MQNTEKNKTLWCILVCLLLLFLVLSLFTYRADTDTELTYSVDSDTFSALQKSGYSESKNEKSGIITYTANNNDPWTHIPMTSKIKADFIIIDFAVPITKDTEIVVYYSPDGGAFDAAHAYAHAYALDHSGKLVTLFVENMECCAIRLDMNGTFAINSVDFYNVEPIAEAKYSLNFRVLILLALVIALLIVFEKRLGFFDWIKSTAVEEYNYIKGLIKNSKYVTLITHLITRICALSLLVTVSTVFFKSSINKTQIILAFVFSCATIIFTVIDKVITRNYTSPARLFFVTAMLLGIMFTMCLPFTTFNVPDEEIHYACATDLKNFLFGTRTSFTDLKMEWRYYDNHNFILDPLKESKNLAFEDSILFDLTPKSVNLYKNIGYLPSAVLMAFADLMALSYVQIYLTIKFANLLTYSFVISMGIRRLKSGGYIFSAICLMPLSIILAASFSYDCWVMTFITFSIAYFISEIQQPDKKFKTSDFIFMIGAMFLGCGPKAVYFVLMLPFLFVTKRKFETKKQHKIYITVCLATMATILLSFVLPFLVDTGAASDIRGGTDVNATEQLKFILKNPLEYATIFFNFISDYLSFENMSNNITTHTYLGSPLTIYATVMIFIIMFATFTDKSEYDMFENRHLVRSVGLLGCVGALLLVVTALYIAFTPVAHSTINGVQFRYVFPIMPLFFYSLGSARVHSQIDKRFTETFVFGLSAIVSICSLYEFSITNFLIQT